jgi:hypothetical protein
LLLIICYVRLSQCFRYFLLCFDLFDFTTLAEVHKISVDL